MATPFTATPDSATIGTSEYFLASDSTTATYQTAAVKLKGWLNFSAMVAGDQYQVTIYEKVNGSAVKVAYGPAYLDGVQATLWEIPQIWVKEGWEIGVKKLAGTDRSIGWALNKDVGDVNLVTWLGTAPNAVSFGRIDVTVGQMAANVLTATAIATGAITSAKFAAGAIDNAAIASNAIAAANIASNAITSAKIATDAIGAAQLAADAVDEIWDEAHEGTETVRQALRLMRAILVGKATGLTGTTPSFRNIADTLDRVVHTLSGAGDIRTPTTNVT